MSASHSYENRFMEDEGRKALKFWKYKVLGELPLLFLCFFLFRKIIEQGLCITIGLNCRFG
jgi:hypothetical protein